MKEEVEKKPSKLEKSHAINIKNPQHYNKPNTVLPSTQLNTEITQTHCFIFLSTYF